MLVGIDAAATERYSVNSDPGKGTADATVFLLGSIPRRVEVLIRDRAIDFAADPNDSAKVEMKFRQNDVAYDLVSFGLKGWEKFQDKAGNEIEFKTVTRLLGGQKIPAVAAECMDRLSLADIRELAERLTALNSLTPLEAKNSAA